MSIDIEAGIPGVLEMKIKRRIDEYGRECTKCGEYKLWDKYPIKKSCTHGHSSQCRECTSLASELIRIKKGMKPVVKCRIDEHGRECTKCGEYKLRPEFVNGGKGSICLECNRARCNEMNRRKGMKEKKKCRIDEHGRECTKCGEYKLWPEFNFRNKNLGKRNNLCKKCSVAEHRRHVSSPTSREKIKAGKVAYYEKIRNEPKWMVNKIGRKIGKSLRGGKGRRHWEGLVGYTREEFVAHLESRFEPGMSWDNYGSAWHIDHIIPVVFFLFSTTEDSEFHMCWRLENLRPLWATREMANTYGSKSIGNLNKADNIIFVDDEIHRMAMCAYIKGVTPWQDNQKEQAAL